MKNNIIIYSGILLLALSVYGIFHASRVVLAQNLYSRAKYGTPSVASQTILDLCGKASRLYGHNYYVCILAAEAAYYEGLITTAGDASKHITEAQKWCDKGLELNCYRMPLRRLKAFLLARTSPADAAHYWEKFVDWQYWEPSNHALLVELYALSGQYEKAVDSLALIKDTSDYQAAGMKLNEAWKKEKDFPAELSGKR